MPINVDKSRFGQIVVHLLGYVVSRQGIEMDNEKVQALLDWPQPTTVKQLTRFLGAANYYRQFVKNFSLTSHPLDVMRKKSGVITWTEELVKAFNFIKQSISEKVLLHYPDDTKPFKIWTDASSIGLGAWISQDHEGELRTLWFASRALSQWERNYSATKLFLLAVVWSLNKFKGYIFGKKFTAYTDHNALIYLFTQKHANHMMIKWFEELSHY